MQLQGFGNEVGEVVNEDSDGKKTGDLQKGGSNLIPPNLWVLGSRFVIEIVTNCRGVFVGMILFKVVSPRVSVVGDASCGFSE